MSELRLRRREGVSARRPPEISPELRQKIDRMERQAAEDFRGIAPEAGIAPGLFPLKSTGVDLTPVTSAAQEYLAGLSPDQLAEGHFPMRHRSWRHWTNGARYFLRHGLCLEDLDEPQRARALKVIQLSLSRAGFTLVTDLMHLNATIGEIRGELDLLNELLYWFSLYGEPTPGQPWGWQLDGHHVNVNCVFVGDQMTLTPTFLGAEPVFAAAGKYAGTRVFSREEADGLRLFSSLNATQRAAATIGDTLPPDLFTGAFRDNFELNYEGIPFDRLTTEQHGLALDLIARYTDRATDAHAAVRMREVLAHDSSTYFGWIGDATPGGVFYYRVHSPVILIEFEHQAGVMFDNDVPTRNHVHTVVRTPNGNDYGIDLLRQHHERHHQRATAD
jgi:hypothetical protein